MKKKRDNIGIKVQEKQKAMKKVVKKAIKTRRTTNLYWNYIYEVHHLFQ